MARGEHRHKSDQNQKNKKKEPFPGHDDVMLLIGIEIGRQGYEGIYENLQIAIELNYSFGIIWKNIIAPVRIFYGAKDNLISLKSMKWLANELVSAQETDLVIGDGKDHRSIFLDFKDEACMSLMRDVKQNFDPALKDFEATNVVEEGTSSSIK